MTDYCRELDPDSFMAELALTQDAVLVDVRTGQEVRDERMLEGAVHVDFLDDQFDRFLAQMDPFRYYYLYCDNGKRSSLACRQMAEQGFLTSCWMRGGLEAWKNIFKPQS